MTTQQHPHAMDPQSKPTSSQSVDPSQLDVFIQSSLDKFFFVEPWDELYKNTENFSKYIISNKSTIPDLIIFNKTFNKNDCFEGSHSETFSKFPRMRFILRAKPRATYNPKDTFVSSTTEASKPSHRVPSSLKELLNEDEEKPKEETIEEGNMSNDNSFDFNAFSFAKKGSAIQQEKNSDVKRMHANGDNVKGRTNNYNEDEEEDPEWGDDDVMDFKKSKVSFREIPTELKESAEQQWSTCKDTKGSASGNVVPEIKFEQKEQVFTNNDEGGNLFEQIETYLMKTEEKEKEQMRNISKQKQMQMQHMQHSHNMQNNQQQTQIFSSEDFFDKLASNTQQQTSSSNNQFPSSLYAALPKQQNNMFITQDYQKKKKHIYQDQQTQHIPINVQNTQYIQPSMFFHGASPNQNMNMNLNMNFSNSQTPPFHLYNTSQHPNVNHMQIPQMSNPQTPQQLQFLYQLQQNQLHQLYLNQQRQLQKQHQRQLNQLFPMMKQTPPSSHQIMYNPSSQTGNTQYNMRSPLVNMNMNMNMHITLPQSSQESNEHQNGSDDEEDDDPLMNDFETNYTSYNPTVFLENPALIVKKNLIEAHWFLMKDNKILGNYNSEELLFFLGEKIKDGELFENVCISDYHTDLVFQPKNLYEILKEKVPSLKKKYMKSKMGLNKKKTK